MLRLFQPFKTFIKPLFLLQMNIAVIRNLSPCASQERVPRAPQQNASDISDKNTLGSPKFAYAPEQLKEETHLPTDDKVQQYISKRGGSEKVHFVC
jgi:hypothetical protein